MNPLIKKLMVTEDTTPDGKLLPQVVMYLNPEQVANQDGCRCGSCIFFDRHTSECFLTIPPACDAEHGVCGLYMGGPSPDQCYTAKPDAQRSCGLHHRRAHALRELRILHQRR